MSNPLKPEQSMNRQQPVAVADGAEAVNVAVSDTRPVDELDAQLEGALSLPDEIGLVDLEHLVEQLQMRHGGFAHAHCADLLGFDQLYRTVLAQELGKGGGGHPARRTATNNHDIPAMTPGHRLPILRPPQNL